MLFRTRSAQPSLRSRTQWCSLGKAHAYLVWGIRDSDHAIVGTKFDPWSKRVGAEELENWLARSMNPQLEFRFHSVHVDGHSMVVLEIEPPVGHPARFQDTEFVRVGSYTKRLAAHPGKERALWRILDRTAFESGIAAEDLGASEVMRLLDFPSYFELREIPLPSKHSAHSDRARIGTTGSAQFGGPLGHHQSRWSALR